MPRLELKTRNSPASARKQHHQVESLRLRRSGLSYRAIGKIVGISHERARELCEEAYRTAANLVVDDAAWLMTLRRRSVRSWSASTA